MATVHDLQAGMRVLMPVFVGDRTTVGHVVGWVVRLEEVAPGCDDRYVVYRVSDGTEYGWYVMAETSLENQGIQILDS